MDKPLKIALLSYRSKQTCGGQGIYIQQLSEALWKCGHEITVISGKPYPQLNENIQLIKLPGLNLLDLQQMFPKKWWTIFKNWPNFYEWFFTQTGKFIEPAAFGMRLRRFFQKTYLSFDIIHDNQCLSYASLELQKKYPFLTTIHHPITKDLNYALKNNRNFFEKYSIRRWYSFLNMQKKVAKHLKNILTVSDISKADIVQDFDVNPVSIKILPLGIDTEIFSPNESIAEKKFHILCISNSQNTIKGLIYLLKALKLLIQHIPTIRLTVVGEIHKNSECGRFIQQNNLAAHIQTFQGIEQKVLIELYQSHPIVVIPSIYEGFCIPALEALSMGKAIIGTHTGAIPAILGKCGILVPAADSEALARNCLSLLNNPNKCRSLGKMARQRALNHFQWKEIANEMVKIYKDTVKNAHH